MKHSYLFYSVYLFAFFCPWEDVQAITSFVSKMHWDLNLKLNSCILICTNYDNIFAKLK